jgi:uncharacterized protein YdaU (DUF1376 family)
MTERPDTWMPMYWADYFADTGELSVIEHGAYLLLIGHYWRKGALPDDDERLARIARCTPAEWRRVRPAVAGFFTVADGTWTHGRIEREWERAANITAKRAAAGRASAEQRKGQQKTQQTGNTCSTHVGEVLQQNARPSPSPSHSHPSDERESASPLAPPPAPPKAKGTRLPSDWELPPDWRTWATDELLPLGCGLGPTLAWVDRAALRFRDHWLAKTGKDGAKADWQATWRNWVRRDIDEGRVPRGTEPAEPAANRELPPEECYREATPDEQELARRLRKFCGRQVTDAQVAEWRRLEQTRAA